MAKKMTIKEPVAKPTVKLISYEIKAVIPTGLYANIQPCIIVEAPSIEEASAVVLPHIDAMYEKYLNITERTKNIAPTVTPKKDVVPPPTTSKIVLQDDGTRKEVGTDNTLEMSPRMIKAIGMIDACQNIEGLQLIRDQIGKSVKLTIQEKIDLNNRLNAKHFTS